MAWLNAGKQFLERHFFFAADARSLNLFRAAFSLIILWRILADAPPLHEHYNSVAWDAVPTFQWLGIEQLSAQAFMAWQWVLVGALALTMIGAFTRVSAAVACVAYFIYIGTYLGFTKCAGTDYVYHSKNIVPFIMLLFAISPGINIWGVDGWLKRGRQWSTAESPIVSAWPTQVIKLMLGVAYFGAGYCKIASSPAWADGYTLQAYLVQKYLLIDKGTSLWLSQYWWACLGLGVATLMFELTFFIIVLKPRLTWLYVIAGIGFHLSILLSMEINFFPYFGATYLIFIEWKLIQKIVALSSRLFRKADGGPVPISTTTRRPVVSQKTGSLAGASGWFIDLLGSPNRVGVAENVPGTFGCTRFAMSVVLAFWIIGNVCVFFRIEAWPLSDYGVFRSRINLPEVGVVRMGGITADGKLAFLERDEYPMGERLGWWINYSRMRRYRDKLELQDETFSSVANYVGRIRPGKYISIVAVKRTVEGVPGQSSFKINNCIVMEQAVVDRGTTPGAIVRIAEADQQPVQRY